MPDPILVNQGGLIPMAGGLATESCRSACCGPGGPGTPSQCCGDRGSFVNPIPATCRPVTFIGFEEEPSLKVLATGFVRFETFLWPPRVARADLNRVPFYIQIDPTNCHTSTGFQGAQYIPMSGHNGDLWVILDGSAHFPTTELGFSLPFVQPGRGGTTGRASGGRSEIISPTVTIVARFLPFFLPRHVAGFEWSMNTANANSQVSASAAGPSWWVPEITRPLPLRQETCIPGVATNHARLVGHRFSATGAVEAIAEAELEFDWTDSILGCPGDSPGAGSGCGSCGGDGGLALGEPL